MAFELVRDGQCADFGVGTTQRYGHADRVASALPSPLKHLVSRCLSHSVRAAAVLCHSASGTIKPRSEVQVPRKHSKAERFVVCRQAMHARLCETRRVPATHSVSVSAVSRFQQRRVGRQQHTTVVNHAHHKASTGTQRQIILQTANRPLAAITYFLLSTLPSLFSLLSL